MRDLMNQLHLQPAFAPKGAVTDGTAQVSLTCDMRGYESVMLALITGTLTDADAVWSVLIEESDDDSTYTTATALVGTAALAGFQFDSDNKCRKIGYNGTKRYVRATIDDTTANTGNLFVAGVWVLGSPSRQATANPPA